jgi:hypothetical protein
MKYTASSLGGHLNTSVATKKKPPVMTECEVKVRGRWLPCTIYEALTERDQLMRCKYCHSPVQALKESSNGARAHIEHLQRHTGCRSRLAASVESNPNIPSR